MPLDSVDDDLKHLGQLLWRYRQDLADVEYLLDVQDLLVSGGREKWLGRTADQLRSAVERLVALDAQRAAVVQRLAPVLGLSAGATLGDLARVVPDPWAEILADHVAWFRVQLPAVGEAVARTRTSVEGGLDGITELLRTLTGAAGSGYDSIGRPVAVAAGGSLLFDDRA